MVGNSSNLSNDTGSEKVYFVSSSGEICYSKSDCFSGIPRAGIRPVVTMNKNNIKYNIYTKTDGNGTIEVVSNASGGETISFKTSAKKGLKLAKLIVTTDSSEKVEFSEEDITQDETGVYTISTNKFTMPYENVTIEAEWSKSVDVLDILKNPKTGDKILVIIVLVFLSLGISLYMYNRKKSKV